MLDVISAHFIETLLGLYNEIDKIENLETIINMEHKCVILYLKLCGV